MSSAESASSPWRVCQSCCDLLQHLQETRPAVAVVRREIGAAEERLQVRREKDVQRPAALAGRGLHERHVDLVHVRPLLAVHFDADEMLVEKRGDLLVSRRIRAP